MSPKTSNQNSPSLLDLTRADLERASKDQLIELMLLLLEQNRSLHARVTELERRLGMNSNNSSKPPSSDPPGTEAKRRRKKKSKRKRGAQPGHKAHFRDLVPADQVDKLTVVEPERCDRCGGIHIKIDFDNPRRHQVVEIPPIRSTVWEWQLLTGSCLDCGSVVVARLPEGVPSGSFGSRLQSLVALLSGVYHQSKRFIQSMLSDVFGISICLGSISACEKAVSQALEGPVEEACQHVQAARVVHADETGWRQCNKKAWLWVAATSVVTLFMIHLSRGRNGVRELLGRFRGILVSDRWGPYSVHKGLRQFCWAHLLRTFIGFSEMKGKPGRIGQQLVGKTNLMFKWWHRVRDGPMSRSTFRRRMTNLRIEIEDLLIEGEMCGRHPISGVCKRIIRNGQHLFTFVDHEGVEPTNNLAERQLRQGVLWRKICFGTQSVAGSRFVERIMTAAATCRQQDKNTIEYLNDACHARLHGHPAPSLLPSAPQTS